MARPGKPKTKYVLGGRVFSTQKAVKERAKEILNRVPLNEPLRDEDELFIRDLFFLHDERLEKLGECHAVHYFVRKHPVWHNRNFMVMRSDGEAVHFSYPYALKATPLKHWFGLAARTIVDPQKRTYRDAYFARYGDSEGRAPCELTGVRISPEECDVHHAGEMPFRLIVSTYLKQRNLDPEQIEFVGTTEGADVLGLADEALAIDFAHFHEKHAVLQVVSTEAHRQLTK